jgi:hypothetical protein
MFPPIAVAADVTEYADTAVLPETTYVYRVRATDSTTSTEKEKGTRKKRGHPVRQRGRPRKKGDIQNIPRPDERPSGIADKRSAGTRSPPP